MKTSTITLAMAVMALFTGCNTLDRSRSLGNPAVSANVIAQQVCSNCHGVTGNAESPNFPNLAAQQVPYFIAQLNGFKSHGRADPAGFEYMWGLSKHLTDEQIAGLAAYYAKQSPKLMWQSTTATPLLVVQRGARLRGMSRHRGKRPSRVSAPCRSACQLPCEAIEGISTNRRAAGGRHYERGCALADDSKHGGGCVLFGSVSAEVNIMTKC